MPQRPYIIIAGGCGFVFLISSSNSYRSDESYGTLLLLTNAPIVIWHFNWVFGFAVRTRIINQLIVGMAWYAIGHSRSESLGQYILIVMYLFWRTWVYVWMTVLLARYKINYNFIARKSNFMHLDFDSFFLFLSSEFKGWCTYCFRCFAWSPALRCLFGFFAFWRAVKSLAEIYYRSLQRITWGQWWSQVIMIWVGVHSILNWLFDRKICKVI